MSELLAPIEMTCPYCWEIIETSVDLSVESQQYIEDCQVCCRPISISYRVEAGSLVSVDVAAEDG